MFALKKLLAALLLPPLGPLLLIAAGLLLIRGRRRGARVAGFTLAWGGVAIMLALSLPPVARALNDSLGGEVLSSEAARPAQAIVVLAGGVRRGAPEYGGVSVPNEHSLIRLRYGAYLHRQTGLPLLLSGGPPADDEGEAVAMARTLRDDYGIKARWVEDSSLDTQGNAENSARLLAAAGIDTVLLVTERFHMRRARAEFERTGIRVIAAPTNLPGGKPAAVSLLPSFNDFLRSSLALHEWLGIAAQQLR
jgi:uncharacterized SAM-binding protein YcdF (DUF218 family)